MQVTNSQATNLSTHITNLMLAKEEANHLLITTNRSNSKPSIKWARCLINRWVKFIELIVLHFSNQTSKTQIGNDTFTI